MPPVPGSGNTIRGGVQATDDSSRSFLIVDTACMGTVHGVRGGYGNRVTDIPSTDAAQEGSGRETSLGGHGPQRRATNLQDVFPNRG